MERVCTATTTKEVCDLTCREVQVRGTRYVCLKDRDGTIQERTECKTGRQEEEKGKGGGNQAERWAIKNQQAAGRKEDRKPPKSYLTYMARDNRSARKRGVMRAKGWPPYPVPLCQFPHSPIWAFLDDCLRHSKSRPLAGVLCPASTAVASIRSTSVRPRVDLEQHAEHAQQFQSPCLPESGEKPQRPHRAAWVSEAVISRGTAPSGLHAVSTVSCGLDCGERGGSQRGNCLLPEGDSSPQCCIRLGQRSSEPQNAPDFIRHAPILTFDARSLFGKRCEVNTDQSTTAVTIMSRRPGLCPGYPQTRVFFMPPVYLVLV